MDLTIAFVTARRHCEIVWFLDSLLNQLSAYEKPQIIIVDYYFGKRDGDGLESHPLSDLIQHVPCKPNVWQGPHRLTPKEWWAKSAYINTAICLANRSWIAFVDDRSVLLPTWLTAVRAAIAGKYAVAGSYDKRRGMTVENGFVKHGGIIIGEDPRDTSPHVVRPAPGAWWFGCTNALPLEWALIINGATECCDSLGLEDVVFGGMLERNGFPIKYDPRMKIAEDRSEQFYEAAVGRTDKGPSPNDKSHGILTRTAGKKHATHHWNLRQVRSLVQTGQGFPIPTEPKTDWWDQKPLSQFP